MGLTVEFKVIWDSEKGGGKLPRPVSCIHSGNAGDIIYALPTVRELQARHVYLNLCSDPAFSGRNLSEASARALAPLLLAQSYIDRVTIVDVNLPLEYLEQPIAGIDFVLDKFRLQDIHKHHLAIAHAIAMGVQVNLYEPWLEVPEAGAQEDYAVVSLTERYRVLGKAHWLQLLETLRFDAGKKIFLGLPQEFQCLAGADMEFRTAGDLLEAARIIKGSRIFLGNQSLNFALAEGLKVRRLLEQYPEMPNVYPVGDKGLILAPEISAALRQISDLTSRPDDPFRRDSVLQEKERQIRELQGRLAETEGKLQTAEQGLKKFYASRSGRLLAGYHRLRDKFLRPARPPA
jgi:hypothetical protein